MTPLLRRLLAVVTGTLAFAVLSPADSPARELGGRLPVTECSTCQSDAIYHWFLLDCCLPGPTFCMTGAHPNSQIGWCGDVHNTCPSGPPPKT